MDTIIRNNHIYRCGSNGGIWLDWMAQGTRVSIDLVLFDRPEDLALRPLATGGFFGFREKMRMNLKPLFP